MRLTDFTSRLALTPLSQPLWPSRGVPAAVLLVLREEKGRAQVLMTRRSGVVRHHPHQICFPGGRRDPGDNSLWQTAVRECQEELGLDQEAIVHFASLPPHLTLSGYALMPFIGLLQRPFCLCCQPDEVVETFWLDLAVALNHRRYHKLHLPELAMPMLFLPTPHGLVWGVTAAILYRLARRMAPYDY